MMVVELSLHGDNFLQNPIQSCCPTYTDGTEAVPISWSWLTVILQEMKVEAFAFLALRSSEGIN